MKRLLGACLLAALPLMAYAAPKVGEVPAEVTLSGKLGGRIDGSAWSSKEITDKVYVMFYVDPDESSINDHVTTALKKQPFAADLARYGSIAAVNMDATWLPNSAITSSLEDKQKEFPTTIYLKDNKKALVKNWKVADDKTSILAFAPDGRVVFYRAGKLSQADVDTLIATIQEHLPK